MGNCFLIEIFRTLLYSTKGETEVSIETDVPVKLNMEESNLDYEKKIAYCIGNYNGSIGNGIRSLQIAPPVLLVKYYSVDKDMVISSV